MTIITKTIISIAVSFFVATNPQTTEHRTFLANQIETPPAENHYCATDAISKRFLDQNPDLKQLHEQLEKEVYQFMNNRSVGTSRMASYTLPVVVHIIHNNGPENISDAQVLQGIQHLNESFANFGYYDQNTGVNTEIEFCMAERDPDGNATNGITRDVSPLTEMTLETQDIDLKDINRWDPFNYINIWLVREICSNSVGCGVAGYAYFPSSHGGNNDGIVMEASWMGSSNASSTVLTHEMGHYLGLYHTFQGACTNNDCLNDGDRVCDTPPDQSTAAVPCNATPNTCSSDVNAADPNNPFTSDQNDMFWNYMDYGDFACYSAFTAGQTARMEVFINGARSSLLDSEACQPACMSPLTAAFLSSANPVAIGSTVNFNNISSGATAYEWLIDGVPFAATLNAAYTFPAAGFFEITLNTTNGDPNCFESFSDTIEVFCPVIADFDVSAIIAEVNEVVNLNNISSNATNYEWFLNGVSQGNAPNYSFSLTNAAVVQVCLEATGALCSDTHCEFISIISNSAADCDLTYIKTLGGAQASDAANVIIPANDGDFFIGGNRADSALIVKITPEGSPVWSRTFKFTNKNDEIYDMLLDSDNQLVAIGYGNTNNDADCFAFRYDYANDDIEWVRTMPSPDQSRFWGVAEKGVGDDFIVTGQTAVVGSPGLGCDAFVMELARNSGTVNWMRNYNLGSCESAADVKIDGNTILITGRFNNAGGGTSEMRGSLTRLDFSGNEIWSRLYLVPTNAIARLYSTDILVENGNIISVSHGDISGTSVSAVAIQFYSTDSDGNIQWAREFDIPGGNSERVTDLLSVPDGFLISGYYTQGNEQAFIIKTDKQGQLLWAKSYGELDDERGLNIIVNDGFIYLAGSRGSANGEDIFLAKLNEQGELSEPCEVINDLDLSTITIINPYDGFHPLTVYDPNLGTNALPGEESASTILQETEICSVSDCCTDQTFVQTFGTDDQDEGGSSIIRTNDGNLFVTGYREDSVLLIKMSPVGTAIWTRSFKFTGGANRVNDIFIDSDNYLVACGYTTVGGSLQGFAFKYDYAADNMIWTQVLSVGTRTYNILEPVAGGDYILMADLSAATASGTANDASIFELDRSSGNPAASPYNDFSFGGSETFSSTILYNNSLYSCGRYTQGSSFAGMRSSLSRFDFNGNEQWSFLSFVPLSGTARIYGRDIVEDNGDLLVTISGDDDGTSATATQFFLQKMDISGNILWTKKYDITSYGNEWVEELIAVSDGYILLGHNRTGQRDLFLTKTDKDGNVLWAKQYGGTGTETISFLYSSQVLEFDGAIYFLGESNSFGSTNDFFVVKTDSNGDVSQDCEFVADIEVNVTDVNNPSNASVDLTEYTSPSSFNSVNVMANGTAIDNTSHCSASCLEICNNGVDDDGDGLIDYYDTDCPCQDSIACGTPFYNVCAPVCEFPIPSVAIEMEPIWSKTGIRVSNGQMVADIDGDCQPDVVAINSSGSAIEVIDSESGQLKYSYSLSALSPYTYVALGDVDNDGMAELFYVGDFNNRLFRVDFIPATNTLAQTWASSGSVFTTGSVSAANFSPGLADFDYNGTPEVYVGNQIFDSQNGMELVNGGQNNQGTYWIGTSNYMTSTSVAVDILPDNACVFCQGLELVAGGQVYTVNLASYTNPLLNDMQVEREYQLPGFTETDGATRTVDFDRDGDLDVVVTTQSTLSSGATIFIWDVETEDLIGNAFNGVPNAASERIGHAAVGDVDNDGWPEIIVASSLNFTVLEDYQTAGATNWGSSAATIKSNIATTDQSGGTGATIFDLNGDGSKEIIYRDEFSIRIFDADLNELGSTSCTSGTATEYPLIADVNGDGETEFLCGCNNIGLTAFKSANLPWIKSRKIWNQFNYFVSNVHDDGSIPFQQQNPHLVGDGIIMNSFLEQQPILDDEGTPINPAPDAALTIDSAFCNLDTIEIAMTICNLGEFTLSELTPISVYFDDPTNTNPVLVQTFPLGTNLESDSCINLIVGVLQGINQSIFIVVNDDGTGNFPYDLETDFPVTSIGECDFQNNIDDIQVNGELPPDLDLGPDIIVCDNGIFEFNAGSGFDNYEWQDGSTDSTFTSWLPGTFWVTAWNECGEVQSDTVSVTIDSATVFDLGPDTVLCRGSALSFAVSGYDRYEWFPNVGIDCDTCDLVTIDPVMTTTYTLVAHSNLGCVSVDSIEIILADTFYTEIDTVICEGETFIFDGMELETNTSTYFEYTSLLGCDSTILVNVSSNGLENFYEEIDTMTCAGTPILFDGISIPDDSIHTFNYIAVNGCDSVIVVNVMPLDTFYTTESWSICEGESVDIFGNPEDTAGDYSMSFTAVNGCDSTVVISLIVSDAPDISFNTIPTCPDDETGSISATVIGGTNPLTYIWDSSTENVSELTELPVGTYSLTVTDANNCTDTASVFLSDVTEIAIEGMSSSVSCFGENDGVFIIDSAFTAYSFSLDGEFYQSTLLFDDLFAGAYELHVLDANGCEFIQSFTVNEPPPLIVSLSEDTTIQLGCPIELESFVNRPPTDSLIYTWTPTTALDCIDCPSPVATPIETTLYNLTVIDSTGCVTSEEVLLRISKTRNVFIPNVFSPNEDGINDRFMIYGGKGIAEISVFTIFDRWGEQIFEQRTFQPNDPAYGWDGFFKGKLMNPGVFVYRAEVIFVDGRVEEYRGSVTLVK